MENNVHEGPLHQVEVATEGTGNHLARTPSPHAHQRDREQEDSENVVPSSVRLLIRSLIERYQLTREQFVAIYDDCARCKLAAVEAASARAHVQQQVHARAIAHREAQATSKLVETNGTGVHADGNPTVQGAGEEGVGRVLPAVPMELEAEGEEGEEELQGEVGKMQNLVKSAIHSYETSSIVELGQKRKLFSLEEELNMKPTSFAQELLDRDQSLVAQAIKKYMNQYSIPQREVVEKTNLNQSHLSQHFLHGVTMKRSKRIKLYHWFEDDQKLRTGKLLSADGSLNTVLESPKVEGSRRRPRWKWSPISTQILTEAFKKNHFPTREQRMELSRICNEAEVAMNNGSPIRGPEGDTEGITEQRVNTWFTNRRKGLTTPSPLDGLSSGASSATTPGYFTPGLPPLLKAATTPICVTTSVTPGHHSPSPRLSGAIGEMSLIPANMQALVSQIQQQVQTFGGGAQHPLGVGQMQLTTPTQAFPLAIALSGGVTAGTVLSSPSPSAVTTSPHHTLTPTHLSEGVPTIISPNHLQALITQLHSSSAATPSVQFTSPANNFPVITIPATAMLNSSSTSTILPPRSTPFSLQSSTPTQVHSITVPSPTLTAPEGFPAVTTIAAPSSGDQQHSVVSTTSIPTLSPSQIQALLAQLQSQAKIQGAPQLQINPGSSVPFAITLPGISNEDLNKAILLTANETAASASVVAGGTCSQS